MTGFERDVAIGIGVGAVVNLLLNAILIPIWSYNGYCCCNRNQYAGVEHNSGHFVSSFSYPLNDIGAFG